MIETIIYYLNLGVPVNTLCKKIGIDEDSFYLWRRRGKKYLEEGGPLNEQIYGVFYESVLQAEADWEINIIMRSFTGRRYKPNWLRDKWLLERRRREDWSRDAFGGTDEHIPDESFL